MAELTEASLLACGNCDRQCAGAHPRKGAVLCSKGDCDQWVMKAGLLSRILKAVRG